MVCIWIRCLIVSSSFFCWGGGINILLKCCHCHIDDQQNSKQKRNPSPFICVHRLSTQNNPMKRVTAAPMNGCSWVKMSVCEL